MPAPIASIGMNTPHGTPQPIVITAVIKRIITIIIRLAIRLKPNTPPTDISLRPPCVVKASINECPPPSEYIVISPNAPARVKGIMYLPAPFKKVIFLKSFFDRNTR